VQQPEDKRTWYEHPPSMDYRRGRREETFPSQSTHHRA